MGTRIRDVSENIPKPMLTIGGQPILWHIMKIYRHFGHRDFVLCLGYLGRVIKEYFLNYHSMVSDCTVDLSMPNAVKFHGDEVLEDWKVTLADTGVTTQTGGRVARIKKFIGNDPDFMLTYGDGVANINIRELVKFHQAHGKMATVTAVHPVSRFGEMEVDSNSRVSRFAEKPQVTEGRINGGFFVLKSEFFDRYLPDDPTMALESESLVNCTKDGELMSFNHEGFWQPMDTFREYQLLNRLWDSDKAKWKVWN